MENLHQLVFLQVIYYEFHGTIELRAQGIANGLLTSLLFVFDEDINELSSIHYMSNLGSALRSPRCILLSKLVGKYKLVIID